jgi:MSP (Major sperm protein) domain
LELLNTSAIPQAATLSTNVTLRHSGSDSTDPIVYRVLASRPHLYDIAPASGKLERDKSVVVRITVHLDESNATDDHSNLLNMHEDTFLIQSATVKKASNSVCTFLCLVYYAYQ